MKKAVLLISLLVSCLSSFSQSSSSLTGPIFQTSLIKPVKIVEVSDGHFFIDFGKAAFGTLSLTFLSSQPDSLTIHLGEKLGSANKIDRKPPGSIRYQKAMAPGASSGLPYLLKLKADKRNTGPQAIALPDSFGVVMPFRYVEIENLKIPIGQLEVRQKMYMYQFNDNASNFTSSDTVLNKIWEMCKHTIKATSFAGIYIDGDRERIPYEADAYINQLSHYSFDNNYSLARRTNEYFINHPTWPTEWILHTVLLFYTDYRYTGDIGPLKKHYEALKNKTLLQLERGDGLISTTSKIQTNNLLKSIGFKDSTQKLADIVDWPKSERDGYEMAGVNTVVNAFHFINLKLMADIASALGKKADALFFAKRADLVKKSINEKLFDRKTGLYVDGEGSTHSSLHGNLFPLVFGVVPKEDVKPVVTFIKSRGMACSVYGAQYLLEALYNNGEAGYGLKLMTADSDRSWWNMIRSGSTMALEAWDLKYKPNLDWNHAWGTAPANIITRYVWGITPAAPGFVVAKIQPQLGPLNFSKITVPTKKGAIHAEYRRLNDRSEIYLVQLPKGMTANFIYQNAAGAKFLLNGVAVNSANGALTLKQGANRIEMKK